MVVHEHEHVLRTSKTGPDEGSSYICVDQAAGIGGLGEFASTQAAQPSRRPDESDAGASAVSFGSRRRRDAPMWRRRCRQMVASRGDITFT
eukprot:3670631-Pleurochrysis_carterae.AAC.1